MKDIKALVLRYHRIKHWIEVKRMDESTYWLFHNELNRM